MRWLVTVILILGIAAGAASLFFADNERDWSITNYPPEGDKVVAFGDSLVAGVGADTDGGFVTMLSKRLGVKMINEGRSGDTTADALARMKRDVLSKDPDVMILLFGGNDYLKRVSVEKTFSNLDDIIRRLHENGAVVLLLGVQGGIISDSYGDRFYELAEDRRTEFVSNVLEGVIGEPGLMYDRIHPNERGYARIADRLEPKLRRILSD